MFNLYKNTNSELRLDMPLDFNKNLKNKQKKNISKLTMHILSQ